MFLQIFIILSGAIVSAGYIGGKLCPLKNSDIEAEINSAHVVLQGVALTNATFNETEDKDIVNDFRESLNQTEVRFSVLKIFKGKWKMPGVQAIAIVIVNDVIWSLDPCGSAITVGTKYLIFINNFVLSSRNSSSSAPQILFLNSESVSLILVSSRETLKMIKHRNTRIKPGRPTATLTELEMSVMLGKRILLVCRTGGYPIPSVTWYKDKAQLFGSVNVQLQNKRYESKLVISSARSLDAGVYKCQALNRYGKSRSAITTVHVASNDGRKKRIFGIRCSDELFCFNHGRCFHSRVLGYRFCDCSPGFTGVRCSVEKYTRPPSAAASMKKVEPELFRSEIEILVIVVAVMLLICVSLLIMIAILAKKLCHTRKDYVDSPDEKSLKQIQISPQTFVRSQVEITNLVFTEQTSESNLGESDSKRSIDLSMEASPLESSAKPPETNAVDDGFPNESGKSVRVELDEEESNPESSYDLPMLRSAASDSENSDNIGWGSDKRLSDLEAQRVSDVDMVEVEPPSGDELYCPSRGLSEMSSHGGDVSSRTSTSMDCESTSSADLSQRLLRQLYSFPEVSVNRDGDGDAEEEGHDEDLSLEEFLGQHCITMGALPDLKEYLGTLNIDDSLTGSYPGSRNLNSFTSEI